MLTLLVLSQRDDDLIEIVPSDELDGSMTVAELFAAGPIEVSVYSARNQVVKMGVDAPEALTIRRKKTLAA